MNLVKNRSKVCMGLALFLGACGSDAPSFIEKPEGIITLTVSSADETMAEDTYDMEELASDDVSGAAQSENAEGISYSAEIGPEGNVDSSSSPAVAETKSKGKSLAAKSGKADKNLSPKPNPSADAQAQAGIPSNSSQGSVAQESKPNQSHDNRAIAKACLPGLKNLAQNIQVIDLEKHENIRVAPNSALAFKITGNQAKLNLQLPAGNEISGICFFVAGHEAQINFASASAISGLVYLARGDQSQGTLEFQAASPSSALIDLKGHQPQLSVLGLNAELCQTAKSGNSQASLSCQP